MSVWEYKVISSGKGGFATPALMETFLNQLGKEEWEIIHFHTPPDNPLAFQGLARRTTQRDWTLEDAAAAAARAEADKLRAEFEAKFRGSGGGGAADEKPESLAEQKAESDDGLRRLRDTEHDLDPNADHDEAEAGAAGAPEPDEWDKLSKEEELPTFFEAIQPLMRRNARGAGMSVGVDHLAKKWGMSEDDIMGALKECGFALPEDEDDRPEYLEYDGDLFWVNVNRRGEFWVNTKEKPRQIFKAVKAQRFGPEGGASAEPASSSAEPAADEAAEGRGRSAEAHEPAGEDEEKNRGEQPEEPRRDEGERRGENNRRRLPEGKTLLERIRPHMRRDRGGQSSSGSVGFLSRALKVRDKELIDAFVALGLTPAGPQGEPPGEVTVGDHVWSVHKDQRGGIWITDRRQRGGADRSQPAEAPVPPSGGEGAVPVAQGDEASGPVGAGDASLTGQGGNLSGEGSTAPSEAELSSEAPAMPAAEVAEAAREHTEQAGSELLSALRPQLKETRTGALAGEICALAESAGKGAEELLGQLTALGLRVPDKAREKAVTVEIGGEALSLTRNAKDEIWLNVKPPGDRKPRRPRKGAGAEGAPESAEGDDPNADLG